jgi:hypothetical protein
MINYSQKQYMNLFFTLAIGCLLSSFIIQTKAKDYFRILGFIFQSIALIYLLKNQKKRQNEQIN